MIIHKTKRGRKKMYITGWEEKRKWERQYVSRERQREKICETGKAWCMKGREKEKRYVGGGKGIKTIREWIKRKKDYVREGWRKKERSDIREEERKKGNTWVGKGKEGRYMREVKIIPERKKEKSVKERKMIMWESERT